MKGFINAVFSVAFVCLAAVIFFAYPLAFALAQEVVTTDPTGTAAIVCPAGHICIEAGDAWLAAVPMVTLVASLVANAVPAPADAQNWFTKLFSRIIYTLAGNFRVGKR